MEPPPQGPDEVEEQQQIGSPRGGGKSRRATRPSLPTGWTSEAPSLSAVPAAPNATSPSPSSPVLNVKAKLALFQQNQGATSPDRPRPPKETRLHKPSFEEPATSKTQAPIPQFTQTRSAFVPSRYSRKYTEDIVSLASSSSSHMSVDTLSSNSMEVTISEKPAVSELRKQFGGASPGSRADRSMTVLPPPHFPESSVKKVALKWQDQSKAEAAPGEEEVGQQGESGMRTRAATQSVTGADGRSKSGEENEKVRVGSVKKVAAMWLEQSKQVEEEKSKPKVQPGGKQRPLSYFPANGSKSNSNDDFEQRMQRQKQKWDAESERERKAGDMDAEEQPETLKGQKRGTQVNEKDEVDDELKSIRERKDIYYEDKTSDEFDPEPGHVERKEDEMVNEKWNGETEESAESDKRKKKKKLWGRNKKEKKDDDGDGKDKKSKKKEKEKKKEKKRDEAGSGSSMVAKMALRRGERDTEEWEEVRSGRPWGSDQAAINKKREKMLLSPRPNSMPPGFMQGIDPMEAFGPMRMPTRGGPKPSRWGASAVAHESLELPTLLSNASQNPFDALSPKMLKKMGLSSNEPARKFSRVDDIDVDPLSFELKWKAPKHGQKVDLDMAGLTECRNVQYPFLAKAVQAHKAKGKEMLSFKKDVMIKVIGGREEESMYFGAYMNKKKEKVGWFAAECVIYVSDFSDK